MDTTKQLKKTVMNIVIDMAMLENYANGDHEFIIRIIDVFIKEMPIDFKKMENYFSNELYKEMGLSAHKMKSSASLFAITSLKANLESVESVIENTTLNKNKIQSIISEINLEINESIILLQSEREKHLF